MSLKRIQLIVVASLSLLAGRAPSIAQVALDIPKDHWAYAAVNDLAAMGLIKGYPPDGKFLGDRTLTRYEMATIVQRVLQRVDDLSSKRPETAGPPLRP